MDRLATTASRPNRARSPRGQYRRPQPVSLVVTLLLPLPLLLLPPPPPPQLPPPQLPPLQLPPPLPLEEGFDRPEHRRHRYVSELDVGWSRTANRLRLMVQTQSVLCTFGSITRNICEPKVNGHLEGSHRKFSVINGRLLRMPPRFRSGNVFDRQSSGNENRKSTPEN